MRYFYYLVITNMLVNVLVFVPRLLIRDRYDGSVMALPVAFAIGMTLLTVFVKSIARFPKQDLADVMEGCFPRAFNKALLLFFSLNGYAAGGLTLLAFGDFTRKFLNPDITNMTVIMLYLGVAVFVVGLKSTQILRVLEIVLLLALPLTLFILFKAFFNRQMDWNSVLAVSMFYGEPPKLGSLAAATYIYSGYAALVVLNKAITGFKPKWLWTICIIGLITSITTLFVPVGFQGADGVGDFHYAWVSTSDSMRIELGFVERVMFIFIYFYGQVAFVSVIVHWHVALDLLKAVFRSERNESKTADRVLRIVVLTVFSAGIMAGSLLDYRQFFDIGEIWLVVRMFTEFVLVFVVAYAARRKKHAAQPT
ncbi:GerAB/ArcD/ProY family transporter [Paenibacillus flagellatus]|uniref:MFS transporter permease n=1 Tax=Paenibacillus flagellatus TaxID=2211139 RepID=A0A2V5KA02_9BACL|nr:GerAB/ArcD/ProY family transporter [Paenibacillus flagellatus]PYI55722.1 hypothetical protein DLM86_08340 [Paenibacillus flagellatus]